jgi:acyl-CoA dehydrogenase
MDFTLTEEQDELRGLAATLFEKQAPASRVDQVEAEPECFDRVLWSELAKAGLIGVALPEDVGGLGFGVVDLALVCEELGKVVAPVPLVWTTAAALALRKFGTNEQQQRWLPGVVSGDVVLTCALPQASAGVTADGNALTGSIIGVPYAHVADAVLVPVGERLFVVRPDHVAPGRATSREVYAEVVLDNTPAEPLGGDGAASWLSDRLLVALAALQAGVTAGALSMAADYTSNRKQFEKPLSSFQGVALKAADGYIDNSAIRATTLQAAWHLDEGHPAARVHVLSAAWWAAEGGQRTVHITQHIHGGIGADITYPIHRYFLWGKQIELLVGGASAILARLGEELVSHPEVGDAVVLA